MEIDAIVQAAAAGSAISGDPDSHPTVESYRLAVGTSSGLEPLAPPAPPGPATTSPASAAPAVTLAEGTPAAGTKQPLASSERGPRRTRESLRVDAIKALAPRKR